MKNLLRVLCLTFCWVPAVVMAGPYTEGGINGYIGRDFRHADPRDASLGGDPNAIVNPIFRGWATAYQDYLPSDVIGFYTYNGVGTDPLGNSYYLPEKALGPATGNDVDVVSLGDLGYGEMGGPGEITLIFGALNSPNDPNHIRNQSGYDFAVFENAFVSGYTTEDGSVTGQMFGELAYVEVSSNGSDFVRFPSVSLTPDLVGPYGTLEISNVYNLAGKHPNANGLCVGTPFDLEQLADHPDVQSGLVDINNIKYVKIVDIPGAGGFSDTAADAVDPQSWPNWNFYAQDNPVYDAWLTWGSGGLDLEAVGVLNEQAYPADINLDGIVDADDLELFISAWLSHFGQENWIGRCDMAEPKDMIVNMRDLAVFSSQWQQVEKWRHYP